jgi:hypothetical protein
MPLNARTLLALAVASWSAFAHAEDEKTVCLTQHEQGQVLRRTGKFYAARAAFAACTSEACPAPVRKRCAELLADLDAVQPSIVVAVHDASGRDLVRGVSMSLDGESPREVPAVAMRVDPGEHMLRVTAPARPPIDRPLVVREGETERRVDIVVGEGALSAEAVAPGSAARRGGTGARVWLGLSAVSFVGAAVTSGVGWGIHSHLTSVCSPSCTESQVEPLRILWPTSFIALGVGVATGVVALTLVLTNGPSPPDRVGLYASPGGVGWRF